MYPNRSATWGSLPRDAHKLIQKKKKNPDGRGCRVDLHGVRLPHLLEHIHPDVLDLDRQHVHSGGELPDLFWVRKGAVDVREVRSGWCEDLLCWRLLANLENHYRDVQEGC